MLCRICLLSDKFFCSTNFLSCSIRPSLLRFTLSPASTRLALMRSTVCSFFITPITSIEFIFCRSSSSSCCICSLIRNSQNAWKLFPWSVFHKWSCCLNTLSSKSALARLLFIMVCRVCRSSSRKFSSTCRKSDNNLRAVSSAKK